MEEINALLSKHNHFKYEQIRSIENLPDNAKLVTLVIQDEDGNETDVVKVEFSDITASRILENSVLPLIDMSDGVTIIEEHNLYGFALGRGTAMLHVHNAPLYIVAGGIKVVQG